MNVFLSYSSKEHEIATRIAHVLRNDGDSLFFDRLSLPVGETYDKPIREAIQCCDLFVFLVSPASVTQGSYSLAELSIAESMSELREFKVLPVMVSATDFGLIPPFLRTLSVLQPQGDIVAETLAAIADVRAQFLRDQTKVTVQRDRDSWTFNFNLYDVREIFYRFGDTAAFKSTGFLPHTDPRTGRPIPAFFVIVPKSEITGTLQYKYLDHRAREHGPFSFVIDEAGEAVAQARTLLEMSRPWVRILPPTDGQVFAFFAPLAICREALREIRYSIDNDSLETCYSFNSTEEIEEVMEVPPATSYVCLKLLFIDGTESPVEKVFVCRSRPRRRRG